MSFFVRVLFFCLIFSPETTKRDTDEIACVCECERALARKKSIARNTRNYSVRLLSTLDCRFIIWVFLILMRDDRSLVPAPIFISFSFICSACARNQHRTRSCAAQFYSFRCGCHHNKQRERKKNNDDGDITHAPDTRHYCDDFMRTVRCKNEIINKSLGWLVADAAVPCACVALFACCTTFDICSYNLVRLCKVLVHNRYCFQIRSRTCCKPRSETENRFASAERNEIVLRLKENVNNCWRDKWSERYDD